MEDIVDRTLNFNQSLSDDQRLELVEILAQIIKDGDSYIIPGVFLIASNPPTEEDILKAEEIMKRLELDNR